MMERLDKIIASQGKYSRSEVKKLVKQGRITINEVPVKKSDIKLDAQKDQIKIDGRVLSYKKHIYIMLNKPKGVVSATEDAQKQTVIDLVPKDMKRDGLFPAGRLDGDTVGFVLITDDGDFAHKILSPKNHIMKTYVATLQRPVTDEDILAFKNGIELRDGTVCLEAQVAPIPSTVPMAQIRICEGKYHQVKRMFASLGNKVLELKRTKMGELPLDESLCPGQCREITPDELKLIERENKK